MAELKAGLRLRSAVCSTEVIVIKAPGGDVDLRCGGAPMIDPDQDPPDAGSPDERSAQGTALGKRYVDASGQLEVLCTKPGQGSLSLGTSPLSVREAKALPSSD